MKNLISPYDKCYYKCSPYHYKCWHCQAPCLTMSAMEHDTNEGPNMYYDLQ